MGSCGLDYLAQVAAFPQPDDKLRTERLEVPCPGRTYSAEVPQLPAFHISGCGDWLTQGLAASKARLWLGLTYQIHCSLHGV